MRRRLLVRAALVSTVAVVAGSGGACIASAPEGIHRQTDQDNGDAGPIDVDGSAPDAKFDVGTQDPHAVTGTEPSHGPFAGGQRVLVHGNGFTSKVRLWFGATEVDPGGIIPVDPTRVQVVAPPSTAGPVDVTAQNGDDESTKRTLAGGYTYDKLYVVPDEGPVSGGGQVEIIGQGTKWDTSTVAKIGGKPCTALTVDSATSLACTVPQGTPGAKPVSVATGAETITILDGYTYEDSDNGFKGGLSGAPLAGKLKILVYDNFSGDPIPGAHGIVGTTIAGALVADADASGLVQFDDPSLDSPKTVTVAAKCHSPITFVDEPVDTVTVYLDPVLSPECASGGDPPPVGGKTQLTGSVYGELVWTEGTEFKKGPWTNVPAPEGSEQKVAYVFVAAGDPTQPFTLPSPAQATTEDSSGDLGYAFAMSVPAGNRALYALAGLQDLTKQPPKFTAYSMGVVRGLPVVPDQVLDNVYIAMSSTLDQVVSWDVDAPAPGPKGPDRLRAVLAVMLGNDGYAILPIGQKTPLLPLADTLDFIGMPALAGELFGSTYLSSARAVTGPTYTAPMSVLARMLTTSAAQVVPVSGFVGVPTLTTPTVNGDWDGMHLATTFPAAGPPIDLSLYEIASGNGLVRWLVAVPKGSNSVEVPDLSGFELAGVPAGPITIGVYGARVDGFDYEKLRYRDLRPQGMSAYSLDYFPAHL